MYTNNGVYESGQRFSLAGFMYGGQASRLGCADCSRYGLGIIPAVASLVLSQAPQILADVKGLFTGSSADATHQQILQWVQLITADPTGAVSGNYTHSTNPNISAANAYLLLNCAAGNQAVLPTYRSVTGDPAAAGCGFEVDHGGRADAAAALTRVNQALNQPAPSLSTAPQPIPQPGNTTIATLPLTTGISLPISASTVFGSTLFGIPVGVLLLVGGVALVAKSRTGRA